MPKNLNPTIKGKFEAMASNVRKDLKALRAAYMATYEVDHLLILLVGNLTLRDVVLTQAERTLLDTAILHLSAARKELATTDPMIYLE